MWCGKPYCRDCGYEGPEIVWASRRGDEHGFLIQDTRTLALRAVSLPWCPEFARGVDQTDQEYDDACAARVAAELGDGLGAHERVVPHSGVVRLALGTGREPSLLCPRCRRELIWRHTGIP